MTSLMSMVSTSLIVSSCALLVVVLGTGRPCGRTPDGPHLRFGASRRTAPRTKRGYPAASAPLVRRLAGTCRPCAVRRPLRRSSEPADIAKQLVELVKASGILAESDRFVDRQAARVLTGFANAARNECAAGEDHVVANRQVARDSHLPADQAAPADGGAAGDSCAAGDGG